MTDLVVGCPVQSREWVLPTWFRFVRTACQVAGLDPEFVFVVPDSDTPSRGCISAESVRSKIDTISSDEPPREDRRQWGMDRYHHMVELRNQLLGRVRQIAPRHFWSLDSDILPAPDALEKALKEIPRFDAVGMRTYMTPRGYEFSSRGEIVKEALTRDRTDGKLVNGPAVPVGVIMASKLLTQKAYSIDYRVHTHGEDVGWSEACFQAGLKLGWAPEARCKHIMSPDRLDEHDERVGF